jgi:hypothetical protein
MKSAPGNDRGSVLVLYTVAMVAMMGMAALAIDLGMLRKAKAEAQRAADASALAGASAFLLDQTRAQESTEAVRRARVLVDTNYMNGVKFDSTGELVVQVIYDSVKVRVTVRRASVPTWFARVFGQASFPVGAKAAAVADNASGVNCLKPLAIADMWQDTGDLNGDHYAGPGETWSYSNPPDTYNPAHYAGDGTGTGLGSAWRDPVTRDWGSLIMLRPSVNGPPQGQPCPGSFQGNKCYLPGWWGLWGPNSASALRAMFEGCDATVHDIGDVETTSPGWKQGAVKVVEDIWNSDAGATWNPTATDAVTGKTGTIVGSTFGTNWRLSKRVWTIAVFSPNDMPGHANSDIVFNNFMTFWFEGCTNGTAAPGPNCGTHTYMVGRFLGYSLGTGTGGAPGTMVRILRLVE